MDKLITRSLNKEHGFSIVELMVALALLGIVLALGYMYFDFGLGAFNRGERQTIAQQAVRLTSDFITSELRFANQIEINPEDGLSETGFKYLYLDENNSIVFRDDDGTTERILADSILDDMPFNIHFTSNVPDDVVIYTIDADNGLYTIETRVQALNLELYRTFNLDLYGVLIKLNEGDGTIVKYKKPAN